LKRGRASPATKKKKKRTAPETFHHKTHMNEGAEGRRDEGEKRGSLQKEGGKDGMVRKGPVTSRLLGGESWGEIRKIDLA